MIRKDMTRLHWQPSETTITICFISFYPASWSCPVPNGRNRTLTSQRNEPRRNSLLLTASKAFRRA